MASLLAGFSNAIKGKPAVAEIRQEPTNTPHYHFIHSMLLPSTVKIQKELRGRRFKEVQAKLAEAVMGMHVFQFEPWPPESKSKSKSKTTATAEAVEETQKLQEETEEQAKEDAADAFDDTDKDTHTRTTPTLENGTGKTNGISLEEHFDAAANSNEDLESSEFVEMEASEMMETESTMGDFSQAPQEDDLQPFDDVASSTTEGTATTATTATTTTTIATATTLPLPQESNNNPTTSTSTTINVVNLEDDPSTREPMHDSIVNAIEAYVLVMMHEQKTNKACEQALECVTQLVVRGYVSGRAGGRDDASGSGAAVRAMDPDNIPSTVNLEPSLMHKLMLGIQKCSESNTATVQSHVIHAFKEIMVSTKCGAHEASMLLAIRSIFHIYLVSQSPTTQAAAKTALMEMISSIVLRMEEIAAYHTGQNNSNPSDSLFHTDSYYLMRSLVKLSSKALPGIDDNARTPTNFLAQQFLTTTTVDPLALHNKVLSLELILQVIECAGDGMCQGEKFIHLVQSQLCVALLKNCMSNNTQVAFLSQRVFLILVYKFKTQLKDEIQVFMTNIFLRVLDSENSSFPQKALVLESLRSLCNDPDLLAQIFLNYDCDFDAMNLYKDIVFHLTRLSGKSTAMPSTNLSKKDAEEHAELSLAAVEVLVTILQAFLKALGMPPQTSSSTNKDNTTDDDSYLYNDMAGQHIRKLLKLEDIAGTPSKTVTRRAQQQTQRRDFMQQRNSDIDGDLTVEDLEVMQNNISQPKQRSHSQSVSKLVHSESSSEVAGKIVDAFDRKRNAEQIFELGAVKFTLSLKSGLKFFIENGFVTLDAKEIAIFFFENKDKLDKTQMGEVVGKEPDGAFIKTETDPEKGGPGFYVRILHHYADAMDFCGLPFDDSIRLFLSGFRLPGEAQKIDRIMEKFAERFTRQNGDIFPSADTAFILAFSVIMLNTDLHNPSIKPERRMTQDSFLRNNRGIGENGGDLDPEFLTGIFNRIKKSPFSLKEDDAAREKAAAEVMGASFFGGEAGGLLGFGLVGAPTTEERKRAKFKKEREEMMSATEQLIRRRKGKSSVSKSVVDDVDPADVIKPMFDVTWGPIIGILSQVLECSYDERSIGVCLNGFVYATRIAAHSNMSLARDTFINSLAKFTFLGSIKEMKHKNIAAIRTLMNIAIADGEYLGESWGPVLQCISQLARMRMSASGLDSDESFLQDAATQTPSKHAVSKSYFSSQSKAEISKETEDMNARAILESFSEQLIDNVFSSTVKLSAHSLADFIRQLVAVSSAEIEGEAKRSITGVAPSIAGSAHGNEDGPSIFCLQRLVEVADFNMDVRPRLVWTQVWEIMAGFFSRIGCHRNALVSVFAIDSLKQLSSKFLEKPELAEFNFQRIFLQPFLHIMENPGTRQDIRELILECIDQMVNTKAHNLQSGWKIFFDILMASANDSSERITLLALNILQRMLDEHLDQLCRLAKVDESAMGELSATEKRNRNSNAEDFIGMCRASLSFVQLKESDSPQPIGVSMRALCHTAIYADLVADGRILPPVSGAQSIDPDAPCYTYLGLTEEEALQMALWRTLLEGLAKGVRCTSRSRSGGVGCLIQRGSVLAIRAIILRHGSLFSTSQLAAVLKYTIIPAFQVAAESDQSPVIFITSESPALSSLDFLVEPMPIPPPRYDRGLLKFEEVARSVDCAPTRPLGPAELLLEASFTDMRHGGNGDLTEAYKFAKKDMKQSTDGEQPFPDSWIATTAPVALGCLTDIASEVVIPHGAEGARRLWPLIGNLMQTWCNGEVKMMGSRALSNGWAPCEALVRIGCREVNRYSCRLTYKLSNLDRADAEIWMNTFLGFFTQTLSQSLDMEHYIKKKLLDEKLKAYTMSKGPAETNGYASETLIDEFEQVDLNTAYGKGLLVDRRINHFGHSNYVMVDVINLSFGMLYQPTVQSLNQEEHPKEKKTEEPTDTLAWVKLVPSLKIRCVAAHFLHQALSSLNEEALVPFVEEGATRNLLKTLNRSREIAESAVKNEDLAHAFQEAMLSEWGADDADMGEEALVNIARLSQTQGCAMFFLTQTAGATHAMIQLLSAFCDFEGEAVSDKDWDREAFAAPYLMEIMKDVLSKFVESEAKEGHRIDPNVWRNVTESGVKVAIYCTSFASVVVGLLNAMLSFDQNHCERNKTAFFPMVCRLIRVQSEEIRSLVQRILLEKFAPMLGVSSDS